MWCHLHIWGYWYFSWQPWFQLVLPPALCMMNSAYKLNKQGDDMQPWHTPFSIWNQSVFPCPVLTCFLACIQISQEAGQVVWYSHLFKNYLQLVVIHTVKGFGIVNRAEVDAFLELSRFFDCPMDVGNLISDSSAFSKCSLNIWNFMDHVLLKIGLENFEHYFASMWEECNCVVVSACFGIAFFGIGMWPSPVATIEFSKFSVILSAALSQLHLFVFEIAQLESHHLH